MSRWNDISTATLAEQNRSHAEGLSTSDVDAVEQAMEPTRPGENGSSRSSGPLFGGLTEASRLRDRDVVDAFVAHLRSTGHPDLQVEWHPDKENRGSPDIDAIAGSFAIEHTSVDRLPDQRMHADWFHRVVGGLEAEVLHQLPFRLIVTFDHGAIGKNQNWRRIRQALKSWVLDEAGHLPDGTHHLDVPGVPFRLHVTKASRRPAKLGFRLWQPEDTTFPGRIRELLEAKARKLAPYRAAELITVLLVESDDIRLFDEEELVEAIRGAFPEGRPPGVDQVWYADTSIPSECEFKELK